MSGPRRPYPLFRWFVLAVCIVVWSAAFTATHLPPHRLPSTGGLSIPPILLHIVGYIGLGLMLMATLTVFEVAGWRRVLFAVVVLMVYAAVDEGTQPFFGRHASFYDWLANMAGSVIAIAVWQSGLRLTERLRRRAS